MTNLQGKLEDASESADQIDALTNIFDGIKSKHFISGMSEAQYKEYFRNVRILKSVLKRLEKDACAPISSVEIIAFASLIMQHAFAIGTYKYPDEPGHIRSVFGSHAKGRSHKMSADDAAALEKNDAEFARRKRVLNAKHMREKRAQAPEEKALMQAIVNVRGDGACQHPHGEATKILDSVNAQLMQDGFEASLNQVRRRLEKFRVLDSYRPKRRKAGQPMPSS